MPARDTFTSTVDGAAGHAALFSDYDVGDDRPTLADVAGDELPWRPVPLCNARRERDGVVTYCGLAPHGRDVLHVPSPWMTLTAEQDAYWRDNAPF